MTRYHRHTRAKTHKILIIKQSRQAKVVDRATFLAAIIEPLVTVPQVFIIFRSHTASGVSLSTWVGYEVLTAVWLWYGFIHKDRLILLYQGLFMIIQTGVIIGGVMYGARW